jgi:hypothetical protein
MDEVIIGASEFWEGVDLVAGVLGELPGKDVKVLPHPILIEALWDYAIALLINPPNAHLQVHLALLIIL